MIWEIILYPSTIRYGSNIYLLFGPSTNKTFNTYKTVLPGRQKFTIICFKLLVYITRVKRKTEIQTKANFTINSIQITFFHD